MILSNKTSRLQMMSENGVEADEGLLYDCLQFADVLGNYIFKRYIGEEGRRWLWAGLAVARTSKHLKAIGVLNSLLGSWHEQHGEWLIALDYHQNSYEITKVMGDKRNEAASLNSIAGIQGIIGEYEQAISGYDQALSIFRELGDKRGEGITLSNLGMAWSNQYNFEKALTFFEPALNLMQEVGDNGGVATDCQ